jgi:hypothetical protein
MRMTERRTIKEATATASCHSVGLRSRLKKAAEVSSATALQHCSSGQRGVFCASSLVSLVCEGEQQSTRGHAALSGQASGIAVVACVNETGAAPVCKAAKRSAYIISKKLLHNECCRLWLCHFIVHFGFNWNIGTPVSFLGKQWFCYSVAVFARI